MAEARLEVGDVWKSFAGVTALAAVAFTVPARSIVALIGPNGAGKTTMLNVLSGVLRPDRGSVRFRGEELTALPPHRIAALGIGRTFQHLQLFPNLTVLDNVLVGMESGLRSGVWSSGLRTAAMRGEEREVRQVALGTLAEVGLAERASQRIEALSFMERRLVELASVLAGRPALVLMDEPAAGLSDGETEALGERLRALRGGGLTLLLVEHHMPLVMAVSDTVVVLDHGVVIAQGQPAEVQAHPDVIAAYLG